MIRTSPMTVKELQKLFGVTRPMVKSVIYNRFNLPADYLACMKFYRVIHLTGHQFNAFLTADGMLRCADPKMFTELGAMRFNIIYHFCLPTEVKAADKVICSFRLAEDSFNIEPVVLVKIGEVA